MTLAATTSPATAPASSPLRTPRPDRDRYAGTSWRALGTYVNLVVADASLLPAAQAQAAELLDAVDLACSRFRVDSELTRANRDAGRWVEAGPLLVAAVRVALTAAEDSGGLVDPTLGLTLAAAGYDRDLAEVLARAPGAYGPSALPVLPVPDAWREVGIDSDGGAIRVPAGTALDLGATGKAFAADLVAARVGERVGCDLIISLGGDVAVGAVDPDAEPHPWRVEISELPTGEADETVLLERGGMATSGVLSRRWRRGDAVVHHLIDPRTGRPVQHCWRTVSVAADDCVRANTASTASIVMGERAPEWLAGRGLAARLVSAEGDVLRVAGWPAEGER